MFTKTFWKDAGERALRTVAQSAIGLLTVDGAGLVSTHWTGVVSVAGLAGVISLLTSLAATGTGNSGTASFVTIDESGKHSARSSDK